MIRCSPARKHSPLRAVVALAALAHATSALSYADVKGSAYNVTYTKRSFVIGGEPTLVKPLGRYIQKAKELGFDRTMVTNGTFIEQRIDELADLDRVICSIHGDPEEHDRVVAHPGAFEKAVRGLRMLRERGVEVIIMVVLNSVVCAIRH